FVDLQTSMSENDIYFKKCLSYNQGYIDFHEIIDTNWSDVILKPYIREQIRDNSVGILEDMEALASIGMCPNRNMILISPPGMAKTTMFRATSNELENQATRIWCTGKSIVFPEHVTSLFEAARSLAPAIVFIEDMDLFGGDRTTLGRDSSVLNEFLAQLDGTQANSGVVVLASTNDIASMDEALVNRPGRFSVKVEIPFPDREDRHLMLMKFLQGYNAQPQQTVTKDAWESIIDLMDGFTGDYVKEVAKQAVIRATRDGRNVNGKVLIVMDDLNIAGEQVMRNYRIGQKAHKHITTED
ncbi:MAG: AAA family ATPase, partial [bacterium]